MSNLVRKFRALWPGERRGVTALEYGLIAAVIGGVVIVGANTVGNGLTDVFATIGNTLTNANG